MKKKIAMIMCSLIILSGCGDTNYHASGDISIDDHSDDHSEKVEGQIATNTDINPDIDVINDKSTNNINNNASQSSIVDNDEYQQLLDEKNKLQEENDELNNKIDELESKDIDVPVIEYKNLGLSINGEDIPINKSGSMVTIDGREYVSKEIADKLISNNENLSINNDTLYIGKIISDKANLFDKHINSYDNCTISNSEKDSYGNLRSNVLYFYDSKTHNIIFVLDRKYTFLKYTISMSDNANTDRVGNIVIKADDDIVYTSESLNKQTEPFEVSDIPINNCSLLTIEYNSDYNNQCIISDAVVYNANTNE